MPLYEFIVIARPALAKSTSQLIQNSAVSAKSHNALLRTATILGDRIMTKPLVAQNGQYFAIGRYIQMMVDCSPSIVLKLQRAFGRNPDCMRVHTHRIKDFYQEIQTSKELNQSIPESDKRVFFEGPEKNEIDILIEELKRKNNNRKF